MSLEIDADRIQLIERCEVEEAEDLFQAVRAHPERPVDISHCIWMHSAVFQVLYYLEADVVGEPADPWLCQHIMPLLNRIDQPVERETG